MKKVTQKSRRLVLSFLFVVLVIAVIGVGVLLGLQTFSSERDRFVQDLNQTVLAKSEQKAGLALQSRLMDLKRHLKTLIQNKKTPTPMAGMPDYWKTELLAVAIMERKKTQISVSDHYANTPLLKQQKWDRKLLSQVYQTHPLPLSNFFKSPGTDILNRSLTYNGPGGVAEIPILTVLVEGSYLDPAWAGKVIAVDFLQNFLIDSFQKAESATFFLIRRNGRLVSHPRSQDVITYSKNQFPHPIVSRLQRGFSSVYSMGMKIQGKRVVCSIKQTQFRDVLAVSQMNVEVSAIALDLVVKRASRFAIPGATILGGLLLAFGGFALRRRSRRKALLAPEDDFGTIKENSKTSQPATATLAEMDEPVEEQEITVVAEVPPEAEAPSSQPHEAAAKRPTPQAAKAVPSQPESKPDEDQRLTQLAQTGNIRDIVRGTSTPHPEDHLPHDLQSAGEWIGKICAHLPKKGLLRKKFKPPTELLDEPSRGLHFHGGGLEIWAHRTEGKGEQDFWAFASKGPQALLVVGTVLGDGVCPDHKREIARAIQFGLDGEFKRHFPTADDLLERLADLFLNSGMGKVFASVSILETEGSENEITLHSAGHFSPIRMAGSPVSEMEDGSDAEDVSYWVAEGEILGTEPEPEFEGRHFELAEGDSLLLYTQGVYEAKTKRRKNWDEETVAAALTRYQGNTPENVHNEIVTLFEKTAPKQVEHDATLLMVTRNRTAPTHATTQKIGVGSVPEGSVIPEPPVPPSPESTTVVAQAPAPTVETASDQTSPSNQGDSLAVTIGQTEVDSERRQEFLYGDLVEEKKTA